jgi:disulfide oxidoreductase YuzD
MMNISSQLLEELSIAMEHDPSMGVLDVIEEAVRVACPSRKTEEWLEPRELKNKVSNLTNIDILDALIKFNDMRLMDKIRYDKTGVG